MILDRYGNPEQTKKFGQTAQKKAITVAGRLPARILNEVAYRTHTF
jgi:hypothetical protein